MGRSRRRPQLDLYNSARRRPGLSGRIDDKDNATGHLPLVDADEAHATVSGAQLPKRDPLGCGQARAVQL